jgi:hypothetical protein
MRKLLVLISLPFLLITVPAFGADLVGTWDFEMECLEIGNNDVLGNPGVINNDSGALVIDWQQQVTVQNGALFKGYICGLTPPYSILFGTQVRKEVTVTQWDAIVVGKLKGKKKDTIQFVTQHALDDWPVAPGTCLGKLKRISNIPACP